MSAVTYQEPTLASLPKLARFVLGGWSASGLLTVQSGTPFSVRASGAVLNVGTVGGTGQRADVLGDPHLSNSDRSVNRRFNPSAFALPAAYTWGNRGKNILRGPGLRNFDAAMQKSFGVFREGHRITFRMEATNVFNHVHFANPASDRIGANLTLDEADALLMPGREVSRLAFPMPHPRCDFECSNRHVAHEAVKDPASGALMLVHPSMTAEAVDRAIRQYRFGL